MRLRRPASWSIGHALTDREAAAVYAQHLAADERRFFRGQEPDHRRDLRRLGRPSRRYARYYPLVTLDRHPPRQQFGADRVPRRDYVRRDPFRVELSGQREDPPGE